MTDMFDAWNPAYAFAAMEFEQQRYRAQAPSRHEFDSEKVPSPL
jgi:hypothetical protein